MSPAPFSHLSVFLSIVYRKQDIDCEWVSAVGSEQHLDNVQQTDAGRYQTTPAGAVGGAETHGVIFVSPIVRLKALPLDSNLIHQFRADENMYHFFIAKPVVFHAALGFLIGAGLFLLLRALSYSPIGALLGSMQLSLALALVVACSFT